MDTQGVKKLFETFSRSYDQEKSEGIWKRQSQMFRDFWQNRVMSGNTELTEEEMQPIIRILDANAKGKIGRAHV